MNFNNVYVDNKRAQSYSKLDFPNTYYLAYRDLPEIIAKHTAGKIAVDFGCGTGRSTRFLKKLGFQTTGVDISADMVKLAVEKDSAGDYRVIKDELTKHLNPNYYDLILAVFTFDNIPDEKLKNRILSDLSKLINKNGRVIILVSSPEIYKHEWASFSTKDFPENKTAKTGDKVKIVMTDVEDSRPVEDIIVYEEDYKKIFQSAGFDIESIYKPLGKTTEPYKWINETKIAPWNIYVLKKR